MYRLVPCILILGVSFFIKSAKKMCICDYVKNRIGTCKKCAFWFEKGCKRMSALDSFKKLLSFNCFIFALNLT